MTDPIALPQLRRPARKAGVWAWAMRGLRMGMLVALVALLSYQADRQSAWRADDPVRVEEAAALFPGAARVTPSEGLAGGFDVVDRDGQLLGRLVRTMPAAEDIVGYRGPTDALLGMDGDGTIIGMCLRRSADTPEHLRDVAEDREFMANFTGWRLHDLADYDNARELEDADIWPVSGATLTSSAVIDGVVARAKAQERLDAPRPAVRFGLQDVAIALWVVGGLALMFTRLRKSRRFRAGYRVLAVGWHAGFGGGLVAVSLISGWAMHGPAWRTAPALAAMALLMLALPLALGRNAYCQELCPHGIVQGWLRRVPWVRPAAVPAGVRRGLRWLAPGLLGVALLVVLLDLPMDLAGIEPFDAYPLWRSGGWAWGATLIVFAVGLLVSVRYPMAYCQHACPTGWLLRTAAGRRGTKRFGLTDYLLGVLLVLTAGVVLAGERAWRFAHPMENAPALMTPLEHDTTQPVTPDASAAQGDAPALLVLDGQAMRTTWRVVMFCDADRPPDADALGRQIAEQLAAIESAGSVWHGGSDPDKLNHAPPGEWVALAPQTRAMFATAYDVQRLSGGAFNATLGREVAAAGLGPGDMQPHPPADDTQYRDITTPPDGAGWELDRAGRRARRLSAEVCFDLGGVLQGSAADQIAQHLIGRGIPGVLVEVGGETRALGDAPPTGWQVHLRGRPDDPADTHPVAPGTALAVSDTRTTTRDGRSHLIDPATGLSQPATCRVVVLAPDAATADAWATALAAAGPERAQQLIATQHLAARYEWADAHGRHTLDRLNP